MAIEDFLPTVVTITVGGNDLFRILAGEDAETVLAEFQSNLTQILQALREGLPNARIYISNLYTISEIPGSDQVVPLFNQIVRVVGMACGGCLHRLSGKDRAA
jgi:lysophospholipase L1-like esterase